MSATLTEKDMTHESLEEEKARKGTPTPDWLNVKKQVSLV